MIPGRSRDNWGVGYYYLAPSPDLKDAYTRLRRIGSELGLDPFTRLQRIRDEQGLEIFYNFAVTPWLSLGADLQVIRAGLAGDTAVFPGIRAVIRF